MKDIVKLGITLMIICAVAAGMLAYTNQVTAVVIAQREYEKTVNELREMFPTLADFETREVDGRSAIVATDASGNVAGVLAVGTAAGYAGDIRFNLGVDADGKIVGLSILSHSETADLGSKITEEWFWKQFIGKGTSDSFDVDNISGATVSTVAMESGIEKELKEIVLRFLEVK